jgi:hypothetical protein
MPSPDRAAPPPRPDFALLRWFALSGAAAIGAFSLAMALVLGAQGGTAVCRIQK